MTPYVVTDHLRKLINWNSNVQLSVYGNTALKDEATDWEKLFPMPVLNI